MQLRAWRFRQCIKRRRAIGRVPIPTRRCLETVPSRGIAGARRLIAAKRQPSLASIANSPADRNVLAEPIGPVFDYNPAATIISVPVVIAVTVRTYINAAGTHIKLD